MMKSVQLAAMSLFVLLAGCATQRPAEAIRVGSYNIRYSPGDLGTPNAWDCRKADMVALVRKLDLDVFGMQEVCPDQAEYLREQLPEFAFVGDPREADRTSGEASPVFYRKSRFEAEKGGTFWLSATPEVPGKPGWDAACPRVCTFQVLMDRVTGKRFCLANTHTDHVGAEAREKGLRLVLDRMRELGGGMPIVFTGDHNCFYGEAPARAVRTVLKDCRDVVETPAKGPRDTANGFGRYRHEPVRQDHCIDYIYVADGTRVLDFVTNDDKRPGTDLYPSDHYPITATILLP